MSHLNHCTLCPHHCAGIEGRFGRCSVRLFQKGEWQTPCSGFISAISTDPIEKKPLYHYYPGSSILSIGFWGCNMQCPFCQNWQISQTSHSSENKRTAMELIDFVENKELDSLAFTYSEPLVHYEYLLRWAKLAKDRGIRTVLVTNGLLENRYAEQLLPLIDACNVDLKCFNSHTYRTQLKGNLKTVQNFIEVAHKYCHVETTTLIVPEISDIPTETEAMSRYLAGLDKNWIHHLSAYYPSYQYHKPATPKVVMKEHLEICRNNLQWVYPGNMDMSQDSWCPQCGNLLVQRRGYKTSTPGLDGIYCSECRRKLPFKVSRDV